VGVYVLRAKKGASGEKSHEEGKPDQHHDKTRGVSTSKHIGKTWCRIRNKKKRRSTDRRAYSQKSTFLEGGVAGNKKYSERKSPKGRGGRTNKKRQ